MRRWIEMAAAGQSARRIALDVGLHSLAGFADFLPRMRQRMQSCQLIEDIEYARSGAESLRLDIVKPKAPGPHPVLIYFHGGAFAIASKRTHRGLAAAYASQGYLVCNVDYRLAPHGCGSWNMFRNMVVTHNAFAWPVSQPAPIWRWPSRWHAVRRG